MSGPTVPSADVVALRLRRMREEYETTREEATRLLVLLRSPRKHGPATTLALQGLVKEVCDLRHAAEATLVAFGVEPRAYAEVRRASIANESVNPERLFPSVIEGSAEEESNT